MQLWRTRRGAARRSSPWRAVVAAACCITAIAAACGSDRSDDTVGQANGGSVGGAAAVIDDAGRTVTLQRPARRVISMIPAQTEIVTILAGPDAVIARTRWDDDPRLAHLPAITDALNPSVEWLAAQRPDLVIVWPDAQSRDVVQRFDDIGIPTYASRVEAVTEIRGMIERLGVLLGTPERADSLVHAIDAQLDSVRADVAGLPAPRVLYLLSSEPPMAAGPGTYVDDLITIAGGTNIFDDIALWAQVSLEEIVRRRPDVIIMPSGRPSGEVMATLSRRPGWRDVPAVRNQRVYVVDPDLYNRAGATVGAAARGLAERIHDVSESR